jgi:hypothetical protein
LAISGAGETDGVGLGETEGVAVGAVELGGAGEESVGAGELVGTGESEGMGEIEATGEGSRDGVGEGLTMSGLGEGEAEGATLSMGEADGLGAMLGSVEGAGVGVAPESVATCAWTGVAKAAASKNGCARLRNMENSVRSPVILRCNRGDLNIPTVSVLGRKLNNYCTVYSTLASICVLCQTVAVIVNSL